MPQPMSQRRLIRRPLQPMYYQPQPVGWIIAVVVLLILLVLAGDYIYVTNTYIMPNQMLLALFNTLPIEKKIQNYYTIRKNVLIG